MSATGKTPGTNPDNRSTGNTPDTGRRTQQGNDYSSGSNPGQFKITGNWGRQSTQLKEQYSQLTDSDLKFEPGKENELLGRIENRLNKSRDEVIDIINNVKF